MKKTFFILSSLLTVSIAALAQENDTTHLLEEIIVTAFEQNRNKELATASIALVGSMNGDRNNKTSLVNGFTTVAGVRMEERSPGSYRINIRGSSLRSPFGVRNVKVYWNGLPVTDAGGNTYFNQLAWNNFSTVEIHKGPSSSLYGAGTGGLILLNSFSQGPAGIQAEYITGNYGLQNILLTSHFGKNENQNQLTFAHNEADGFRSQSALRRDNFSWSSKFIISEKQELTASVLFNDMQYETPGALTLAEYQNNPRAARPATGSLPSAENAKAAIYQKNFIAGISNKIFITKQFTSNTSIYATYAQIKNPAIRNYERRTEPQFGGRSTFTWLKKASPSTWQMVAGAEFQQGYFNTIVFSNKNGKPDTLQTNDDINNTLLSFFLQSDISLKKSLFITAGIGLTKNNVSFTRLNKYPVTTQERTYQNELSPRIAVLKKLSKNFSLTTSAAKGFSPPTTAELLPSTGVISTNLEAEKGWNYEAAFRYFVGKNNYRLRTEVAAFYFNLRDALVQRRDNSGADYFVNAGSIKQRGAEFQADYLQLLSTNDFIHSFSLNAAYTFSHFRYGNFIKGADDFSGKIIPSVPAHSFSLLADIQFKKGFYFQSTFYRASKIYLNDANTASTPAYFLMGGRIGWKKNFSSGLRLILHTGVDNLLNEQYSLGNDINAAGGRYYNAAPFRNYYAGIVIGWENI